MTFLSLIICCSPDKFHFFYCYTGLAFSDIEQLKPEHLVKDNNGSLWIWKNREKTNNMCNIPLITVAKMLIDKYADHSLCIKKRVLFPVSTNQRVNNYLKEIADSCEIIKKLTTHLVKHEQISSRLVVRYLKGQMA